MTSLASTSPSPPFGSLFAACRRDEALPPWFLLCFGVVFGNSTHVASSAIGVLGMLLLGLSIWVSGFGSASQGVELVFAGGWIAAWCGAATVLLLTPGLLSTDARAWGAALAVGTGVGLLTLAWRRRSRRTGLAPSGASRRTACETLSLVLGLAATTQLLRNLHWSAPDWIVMTTALLLYAALAKRGRAPQMETTP